jgi:hypothetical protein
VNIVWAGLIVAGVTAVAVAVLLVIRRRAPDGDEAMIVAQQNETAQLLPPAVRTRLSGELRCYARYVVGVEWPRMENGSQGDEINAWALPLFRTLQATVPKTASEQAAYSRWLDQTSDP